MKYNKLEHSQVLIVKTKTPRKWILTDEETGQKYRGVNNPKEIGTHWELINGDDHNNQYNLDL